ncbi:MAG: ribonuclease HI, partial [Myxococcales bacterium]|nr:ribonuclease HI [Myxococcales bacterium]
MPDFVCTTCGDGFSLPQDVIDRFPGWTPRFCRAHSRKKSGSSNQKSHQGRRPSGGRSRRGGQGRGGSAREENLQLADVFTKYSDGPQDGIFTDGSCSPNPGPGGWGVAWLKDGQLVDQAYGEVSDTTNNRMELKALIEALKLVKPSSDVTIYTDSQLCANTINQWAAGWAKRGWKR